MSWTQQNGPHAADILGTVISFGIQRRIVCGKKPGQRQAPTCCMTSDSSLENLTSASFSHPSLHEHRQVSSLARPQMMHRKSVTKSIIRRPTCTASTRLFADPRSSHHTTHAFRHPYTPSPTTPNLASVHALSNLANLDLYPVMTHVDRQVSRSCARCLAHKLCLGCYDGLRGEHLGKWSRDSSLVGATVRGDHSSALLRGDEHARELFSCEGRLALPLSHLPPSDCKVPATVSSLISPEEFPACSSLERVRSSCANSVEVQSPQGERNVVTLGGSFGLLEEYGSAKGRTAPLRPRDRKQTPRPLLIR
ncbi:hypothetical protein C8Q80DRAFT_273772 [Daedaleopsis nitida]|nr:hypothetical protein C8Q80DRAFT_273772 [Daedaleopsis nitida]